MSTPNIWVCRTGDYMVDFFKEGIAGFNLHRINPENFRTEKELKEQILDELEEESRGRNFNGATFAGQIWDISRNVKAGDWIYLDHPNIAPKPRDPSLKKGQKGKQRSFIVAAGVVKKPYKFCKRHLAPHQVEVEWKWKGQALINFGFQSQIFVHVDARHPKVLSDLKTIWTPQRGIPGTPVDLTGASFEEGAAQEIDAAWEEGAVVLKTHREIERSKEVVKLAKLEARKRGGGTIACASCGMVPADIYGVEIIDAHHVVPLKDTKGMTRKPTPADFEMLCPTCHRAVHHVLSKERVEGRDAIEAVRRRAVGKD